MQDAPSPQQKLTSLLNLPSIGGRLEQMQPVFGDVISTIAIGSQQPETLEHLFNCHQNSHNKVKCIDGMSDVLKHANSDKDIAATLVHGLSLHLALESRYQVPQHLQYCYDTQTTYGCAFSMFWIM